MVPQRMCASAHVSGSESVDFEVSCPVARPLLAILRRFITTVAEEVGFDEDDVSKIEMAVDEACSNVILHAYEEGDQSSESAVAEDAKLFLKLDLSADALTIHIQDRGRGHPANQLAGATSIEDYQRDGREDYHGLGLLIMKKFMDDVQIRACPESGTTVILRKYLKNAANAC